MNNVDEFMFSLCKNKKMEAVSSEFLQEWGANYPTTLLFSAFGKAIADNFLRLTFDEKKHLFSTVESAMNSDDIHLRTCTATGLLESLYSRSQSLGSWGEISIFLNLASRRYIDEWTTFC